MAEDREQLARRYAKALIDVLAETRGEKVAGSFGKELASFTDLAMGAAGNFFSNPIFTKEEKLSVLEKILSEKKTDPSLIRFLKLIVTLGHIWLLPDIAEQYAAQARERRNEVLAQIRTAFPLSKTDEEKVAKGLSKATGKEVLLNVTVEKDLIGGVVAEVGGVIYDATIKNYLQRLEQEF